MRRKHVKWFAVAIALLIITCYMVIEANLRPALEQIALIKVDAAASDAMYKAMLDAIDENEGDEASIMQIKTSDERVLYSQIDSTKLNLFAAICADRAQSYLDIDGSHGVQIPMGNISGVSMLTGVGPNINVTFYPESNVNADIRSEFVDAGINQTLHRIIICLNANIVVVLSSGTLVTNSMIDVPISETILVGAVPNTYADVGENEEILHLVPPS